MKPVTYVVNLPAEINKNENQSRFFCYKSDMSIRVDIVDWAATNAYFREIILRKYLINSAG